MSISMADHCQVREGWDDEFDCQYSVSVMQLEQCPIHEQVCIEVEYVFTVSPGVKIPIDDKSLSGNWCLQDVGISGLRREVATLLSNAGIPSAARETTLPMIFEGVLEGFRRRSWPKEREVVGVFLKTGTVLEANDRESEEEAHEEEEGSIEDLIVEYSDEVGEDEDSIFEIFGNAVMDVDEEYGRAVEESMEDGLLYVKARPAKREAVEALERVRVWGEETVCAVCMDEFTPRMKAMKMPCSHVFHRGCLVAWLERQCFCPLCKFELPSAEEEAI